MITIDIRFDTPTITTLRNMVGKEMSYYKADPFLFSTSVYGIVGFSVASKAYVLTNQIRTMDYFGTLEDVAVLKLNTQTEDKIKSLIVGNEMILTPVEKIICSIEIVNETQRLFEHGKQVYEVMLTRGIIFHFDNDTELSFEKNIWFSEDISIEKGYNLISRFTPTKEFSETWEDEFHGTCSRSILTLN